jgi:DNA modification methylase
MVRIDKYKFGEVRYCDCLNKEYGLPSLEDKSFDLLLTDPPFNVEFKIKGKINYKDKFEDYQDFINQILEEIFRISKESEIFCGANNEWYYPKPKWVICWVKQGSVRYNKTGGFNHYQPILFYGNSKIQVDVKSLPDCQNHFTDFELNHPSPKPFELIKWLIKNIDPKSVIDPFLGSGTTAQVCESLGIKWLGYEIKEEYSQDIDKRLKNVKKEPDQLELDNFLMTQTNEVIQ